MQRRNFLCLQNFQIVFFQGSSCYQFPYELLYIFIFLISEYMSGGSVYDYLHKQRGTFRLPSLLKVAIDISKGMNYLHQNNIIHRDLKAANLLMDENEVRCLVSICDFNRLKESILSLLLIVGPLFSSSSCMFIMHLYSLGMSIYRYSMLRLCSILCLSGC